MREASKDCLFSIRANNGYATGRSHQSRLIFCWLFISWTRASVLTRLNVVEGGGGAILVLQWFWQVGWGKNISLLRFVERSGRVWKWFLLWKSILWVVPNLKELQTSKNSNWFLANISIFTGLLKIKSSWDCIGVALKHNEEIYVPGHQSIYLRIRTITYLDRIFPSSFESSLNGSIRSNISGLFSFDRIFWFDGIHS